MKAITIINKETLDRRQYLVSLANAGVQKGLIDANLLKGIPVELMEILKEVIRMYTKGESSTLKSETVEGLMKSIVYSLDLYLMRYSTAEEAIVHLKSCNMKTLYKEAMEYLKNYIDDTKQLYKAMEAKRVSIPNVVYNESFSQAIPNFFIEYNEIFSAQETSCDIDYPLAFDINSIEGIAYIRKYLEAFELENEFCLNFNQQSIISLLKAYGRLNGLNYVQSPINIFELVFQNIIFLTLLDKNYDKLLMSAIEFELIENKLSGLSKNDIKDLIASASDKLIYILDINNPKLMDFIYKYTDVLILRLQIALENGNLANILVFEAAPRSGDKTILELGSKMSNKAFRSIYRRILACTNLEDKMNLLMHLVHSLDDFLDLLKADCFYGNEYDSIFESLGDLELGTLISSEFKEYMLRGASNISVLFANNISIRHDWEKAFIDWLSKQDIQRIQRINSLVHNNLMAEII